MKKIIICLVFGVVLVSSQYYYNYRSSVSELVANNIEVLADGEFDYPTGYPYYTTCQVVVSTFLGIPVRCGNTIVICQGGGVGCNSVQCPIHPNSSI